ncbi:MAG: hypothetical protein ACREV2_17165 [Burkholderiales bacterium]
MATPESWTAPAKEKLKEAIKLKQEARRWKQNAVFAEAAGYANRALECRVDASYPEAAAQELMQEVVPPQIVAGEIKPTEAELPDECRGYALRDTLASPDTAAIAASIERTELLVDAGSDDVLPLAIDAAKSVEANNSLEKMLAHQMALAHKTAFKLVNEAWRQRDSVETARLINASARMMTVYQQGMLTLHRMRTGGNQIVTVQHVNINGGQTVVANNMKAGGRISGRRREPEESAE